MTRRIALLVPLAMFVGFVALAIFRLANPGERTITSKMVGKPFPEIDLPGLDAANPGLATSDLRQGTVTLVNVFASWCIPCRVEASQLDRLAKASVVIHAIAVRDRREDVGAFLAEHGDPFARIGIDPDSKAMLALGASGVPETFLVDGRGVIRKQYIGEIRPEQVAEVLRDVEAAK
jgi:cytochrome c biogenesis protein CcmG/thiol:disulfide interchange protein DsbE